ncbi:MAG: response regulator [Proteobacteria bacterium]|nr:response regulator [Pseudomonadota bacterium]MBU1138124.1 response regulator [Pseudomonadota bacterium]
MNVSTRILLVDDEPRFCDSLAEILSLSGYLVTSAQSGEEAVELLTKDVFDLLLLDVELPDMLGYQIMDHLKGENSGAATIMLTGNATVTTAIEALKKGAYDYLKKPVDHDLLFKTIGKALTHSRLEQALRVSEERSKTMAEASWEGIVIHDNGQLLDANKQFFDMFGYQENELLGEQILDNILPAVSLPEVRLRIKNKTFGSHETIGLKKNGEQFPILTSSRHMEYRGKKVRVCAIRDITERVKAEQEKIELQKQVAITNKMETLGLMAGSVAHDLNNILSGIVTLPELLLMQMGENHEHRKIITLIQEAGQEAASVVSDLITVTRGATAQKRVWDANILVRNYVATTKEKGLDSQLKDIDIMLDCECRVSNIYCSAVHINKILMNLIGNAAEAINGKGMVAVSTKNISLDHPFLGYELIAAGDYVVISIRDDGPGIEEKSLKKIFEPFYSKKVMGRSGTGLGLAIVWNTVHDHDGFIDVQSDGGGTTFNLYFPITDKAVEEEADSPFIEQYRGCGENILVVDDQEKQQKIARNLLDSLGYKTDTVSSGEEAVNYIKMKEVDLIVLDMIMDAGINGRQTYEEILKINPKQRALIASGFAENDEVQKTILLGASQFVKKPYSLAQMGQAVKQALSQT